jgi:hypothetical protein
MPPRLFTLDEARGYLPLVREVVPQIMEAAAEAAPLRDGLMAILQTAAGNGHVVDDDIAARRQQLERLAEVINESVARLNKEGIEVKDLARGLVDFPSQREDRVVYLCWLYDEEDIEWWHELETGFAGRQPL